MPETLPKTVIALAIGIGAFLAVVIGIALWAGIGGGAGQQRGLVLRNATLETVTVALEDGQSRVIDEDDEATFVVRREDFPSSITVTAEDGDVLLKEEVEYSFLADGDFRISFDENGFFHTTEVRETPVRTHIIVVTPAPGEGDSIPDTRY